MQNITFDFSDFHRYGTSFYDYLALRKKVFVDQLHWSVPHNDTVEMDQYDTPQASYSLVRRAGAIVGGARAMATSTSWGEHTYMLRDAASGKLPMIPPEIMEDVIASPQVWECTRLVISDELKTRQDRSECLTMIVDGLVKMAQEKGARELICLSSLMLMRALRQIGYDATQLGKSYVNSEDGRRYAVLSMPAEFSRHYRETHEEEIHYKLSA